MLDFSVKCIEKTVNFSTRVRGSEILDFLKFVLKKKGKIFQPRSTVVEIWNFLEFVPKNGNFFLSVPKGSGICSYFDLRYFDESYFKQSYFNQIYFDPYRLT